VAQPPRIETPCIPVRKSAAKDGKRDRPSRCLGPDSLRGRELRTGPHPSIQIGLLLVKAAFRHRSTWTWESRRRITRWERGGFRLHRDKQLSIWGHFCRIFLQQAKDWP